MNFSSNSSLKTLIPMKLTNSTQWTRLIGATVMILFIALLASDAQAQRRSRDLPGASTSTTEKSKSESKSTTKSADKSKANTKTTTDKKRKSNKKKPGPGDIVSPDPENVVLEIEKEGVLLTATYFGPPTIPIPAKKNVDEEVDEEPGKSVAPFILLHDWDGERSQMYPLAYFLQNAGHAVIVPDLRGHGESVTLRGSNQPLDYTKFRKGDVASATEDIEQCKRFLREKNDLAELNIDLLNVVAVGDTTHLAVEWAISDWSWPSIGRIKQGQDVKSLVLVSPTKKFSSYGMMKMAKSPLLSGNDGPALPMMVIWGANSGANKDCTEIYGVLSKRRPPSSATDPATIWAQQDLFQVTPQTGMTGAQIIQSVEAKPIWKYIVNFTAQKVVAHKDKCPWQIRGKK